MMFYVGDEGNCLPLSELRIEHYDPSKKNVGLLQGIKELLITLLKNYFDYYNTS